MLVRFQPPPFFRHRKGLPMSEVGRPVGRAPVYVKTERIHALRIVGVEVVRGDSARPEEVELTFAELGFARAVTNGIPFRPRVGDYYVCRRPGGVAWVIPGDQFEGLYQPEE